MSSSVPRLPKFLKIALFVFVALAIFALVMSLSEKSKILDHLGTFALLLTLAILIIYTYSTYSLAQEAWTPSASCGLRRFDEENPYLFRFVLTNHCKFSIQCRCRLNASVYGNPLSIGGFYSGQTSIDLQPFGTAACAVIDIHDWVAIANQTVEELERTANDENHKTQLHFDIEFWYNVAGSTDSVENPRQPLFFDFRRRIMVADF